MQRIRILLVATAAFAATFATACDAQPPLHGQSVGEPMAAAPLRATGAAGRPYALASEKGRLVLLYFGYTHCPDSCPTTLADWARARRALGDKADGVRFVFVSVDPERDTPAVVRAWVRQFDTTFVGVAPTQPELEAIEKGWGITAYKEDTGNPKGYAVAHPAQAFFLDRAGRVRMIYPPGTKPADIAADLKRLF